MRSVIILLSLFLSSRVFASCSVRLCEHDHKPGKCCYKGLGSYDIGTLRGSCPGNDKMSSVKIYGQCSVLLYTESGFRGRAHALNGPGYWNSRKLPNDAVSSFKIIDQGCTVTLCEHNHKPGKCCSKGVGSYDIGTLRGSCPGNDEVSLVKIKGGCKIRLYQHSGYRGRSYTLYGPGSWSYGHGKFPNDWTSSFRVSNTRRLEVGSNDTNITESDTN